jgi:hypothetical protein
MKPLIKPLSALMAVLVLAASFGISVTNHICLDHEVSVCFEDESCCSEYHDSEIESPGCCKVESVYVKANFISSFEQPCQKIFAQNFMTSFPFVSIFIDNSIGGRRCFIPPHLFSNRTILLSTSKLTV